MNAWTGKLLRVNLSTGTSRVEDIPSAVLRDYIGGRGVADHYLMTEMDPRVDPFSPENKLIFATGPLTGTPVSCGARYMVVTKGALTGAITTSNSGGHWGPELKFAGYDLLLIEGQAERPVYLFIYDDVVQIRDARGFWGKTVSETEDGIREYLNLFNDGADKPLVERSRTQKTKHAPIFRAMRIFSGGKETSAFPAGADVRFDLELAGFEDVPGNLTAAVAILNHRGQRVALFHSEYQQNLVFRGAPERKLSCRVPSLPLAPGSYHVELVLADGFGEVERVERAGTIDVIFSDLFGTGKLPNAKQSNVVLPCSWDMN